MKCAICSKTNELFSLRFEADETDAQEPWTSHICGTCWEHIAAIATRAMQSQMVLLWQRIEQLEAAQQGNVAELLPPLARDVEDDAWVKGAQIP